VWDRPGPLNAGDQEQIRLHPYYTERALRMSPFLSGLGRVAAAHHERADSSGYPHGRAFADLAPAARLLAAADAYAAMMQDRPHRLALNADEAARQLRAEKHSGTWDAEAVEAVLAAAGHPRERLPAGPAGLTAREVEVLVLLARGVFARCGRRRHCQRIR
jgi:HD-GYP domain-containing protein (c-di-GMP phosphodiesterase class II)